MTLSRQRGKDEWYLQPASLSRVTSVFSEMLLGGRPVSLKDQAAARLVQTSGFACRLLRKRRDSSHLSEGSGQESPAEREADPRPDETDSSSMCCQSSGPVWLQGTAGAERQQGAVETRPWLRTTVTPTWSPLSPRQLTTYLPVN